MRKWLIRLGVLTLLVAAAVALRLTLLAPKERLAVKVVAVARGVVEQTVTNSRAGTVKARLRAHLSPEIGGRIAELPHREGDRVHAGDLLLRVDDTSLRAQLHFAQRESEAADGRRDQACLAADHARRELARNRDQAAHKIIAGEVRDVRRPVNEPSLPGCLDLSSATGCATGDTATVRLPRFQSVTW